MHLFYKSLPISACIYLGTYLKESVRIGHVWRHKLRLSTTFLRCLIFCHLTTAPSGYMRACGTGSRTVTSFPELDNPKHPNLATTKFNNCFLPSTSQWTNDYNTALFSSWYTLATAWAEMEYGLSQCLVHGLSYRHYTTTLVTVPYSSPMHAQLHYLCVYKKFPYTMCDTCTCPMVNCPSTILWFLCLWWWW